MYNKLLTVFTPTYNRSHTLERCYNSLLNQFANNFLWLVIDDGSVDDTKKLITELKSNSPFEIMYVYQENAGKQAAWNKALTICETPYFMCLDSDDALIPNVLNKALQHRPEIQDNANIAGLRCNAINSITGDFDSNNISDKPVIKSWFEEASNNKYEGERLDIFKTDVLKLFPFPVTKDIKFIPESWMYASVSKAGYNFLYLPFAIRIFYDDNKENRLSLSSLKKHALGHYIYRAFLIKSIPNWVWLKNPIYYLKTLMRFSQTAKISKKKWKSRKIDSNSWLVACISYVLCFNIKNKEK